MSFLSVLETVLHTNIVTPEIEQRIYDDLWASDLSDEEMTALNLLAEKLESGETQVVAA